MLSYKPPPYFPCFKSISGWMSCLISFIHRKRRNMRKTYVLVHLSRRLKCTIVIMRCPSSVCPSLTFHIFDFFSETAEQNSTKLDRKQDLNVLYQVCVFRADRKINMAAWPLIGWDILDFSSETAEPNETKLDRKQDLKVLYQVCVFRADQKIKMAAPASDWLRRINRDTCLYSSPANLI